MEEIRLGLKNKVDVSVYANKKYDNKQMKEIRLGLEANIDVSSYLDPVLNPKTMRKRKNKLINEKKNSQ